MTSWLRCSLDSYTFLLSTSLPFLVNFVVLFWDAPNSLLTSQPWTVRLITFFSKLLSLLSCSVFCSFLSSLEPICVLPEGSVPFRCPGTSEGVSVLSLEWLIGQDERQTMSAPRVTKFVCFSKTIEKEMQCFFISWLNTFFFFFTFATLKPSSV